MLHTRPGANSIRSRNKYCIDGRVRGLCRVRRVISSLVLASHSHACCYPATESAACSNTGGPDRHLWECVVSHLENTLEGLWGRLHDWCASPLQRRESEPSRPAQFLNSHTRGTSLDKLPRGTHEDTG